MLQKSNDLDIQHPITVCPKRLHSFGKIRHDVHHALPQPVVFHENAPSGKSCRPTNNADDALKELVRSAILSEDLRSPQIPNAASGKTQLFIGTLMSVLSCLIERQHSTYHLKGRWLENLVFVGGVETGCIAVSPYVSVLLTNWWPKDSMKMKMKMGFKRDHTSESHPLELVFYE